MGNALAFVMVLIVLCTIAVAAVFGTNYDIEYMPIVLAMLCVLAFGSYGLYCAATRSARRRSWR